MRNVPWSLDTINRFHTQAQVLPEREGETLAGVTYLDRTRCHPNSYRRRISRRCRCRNHACIPDRPCTRCTAVHASRVGIWLGGKRWWEKNREDKRVISFRIGKLLPAVVYIFPVSCHQIKLNSSPIAEIYRDWNPIGAFIKQSKIIRLLNFMGNILAIIYLSSCFFTSTVPCMKLKCSKLHLRVSIMTMNQSSVS